MAVATVMTVEGGVEGGTVGGTSLGDTVIVATVTGAETDPCSSFPQPVSVLKLKTSSTNLDIACRISRRPL